jgi:hypothetical protein
MILRRIAFAAALWLAASSAWAFNANNIVVAFPGLAANEPTPPALIELDTQFQPVGVTELDPGLLGLGMPTATAKGTWMAAVPQGIVEIDEDGTVIRDYATPVPPLGYAVAQGKLWVNTVQGLMRIDVDTGAIEEVLAVFGFQQPCFLPNGNMLIAGADGTPFADSLWEIDPRTGEVAREIQIAVGGPILGIAPAPDGTLLVSHPNVLLFYNLADSGAVLPEREIPIAGQQQPCFLPNGLLAMTGDDGVTRAWDLDAPQAPPVAVVDFGSGIAPVPHRFRAIFKGVIAGTGVPGTIEEVREQVTVVLQPNSRRVLLDLGQAPTLAQVFETDTVMLPGFETGTEQQLIQGVQAGGSAPLTAMTLEANGTEEADGFLFLDQASGFLQVASPSNLLASGKVKTRRLLNE